MNISVAVACIFLWYFLFEKIIEKRWEKNLKVKVHCNRDYAYEGEELELVEEIENRKFLILPGLKVKFTTSRYWDFKEEEKGVTTDQYYRNDVFSVGGYERIRRVLPFTCLKRGYYILGDIEVFASNYFYTKRAANAALLFFFSHTTLFVFLSTTTWAFIVWVYFFFNILYWFFSKRCVFVRSGYFGFLFSFYFFFNFYSK